MSRRPLRSMRSPPRRPCAPRATPWKTCPIRAYRAGRHPDFKPHTSRQSASFHSPLLTISLWLCAAQMASYGMIATAMRASHGVLKGTMPLHPREVLQASGGFLATSAFGANRSAGAETGASDGFSIDTAFAAVMRDLGGSADDAGGRVLFTGRDPILHSRFRLGACMACKTSNSCWESHVPQLASSRCHTFRIDSNIASEFGQDLYD